MTLIVANSSNDYIRIVSDSKKTSPEEILRGAQNSVLKSIIINPALCICFAGSIGKAQLAIEKLCFNTYPEGNLDRILDDLLQVHCKGSNDPDFIVGSLSPTVSLNTIKEGHILRNASACWIGNYDAFSEYQKHFHGNFIQTQGMLQAVEDEFYKMVIKMELAFRLVLQENKFADVGEFSISVMTDKDGFKYVPAAITTFVNQSIPSHTETTLKFGSTAEGGYSYSIMTPEVSGIGAIGLHFYQGKIGALFYPLRSSSPIIFRNVTAGQFKNEVQKEFGFEIDGPRIG
jgi:hypothetical protein